MSGPLDGVRVLELAGIGPGPFACMMLADMGADVVRVDRVRSNVDPAFRGDARFDLMGRGRRSVAVDLKHPDGVSTVLRLLERSDVLVEGYRPGVAERLGLGPEECLARNPKLIYGRMTGWGQEGPYAPTAGHDINYIALAGALEPIGRAGQPPTPPLNLIGDFGGGGMLLAYGVACALVETARSGQGQVIDAAMIDGAALLMMMFHGMASAGAFRGERGTNMLDSGAPFYDAYECADGEYVSVGAIEPQFYEQLRQLLGLDGDEWTFPLDPKQWPARKQEIAAVFRGRTRDEWCALLEGTDVCFAPVLALDEAPLHPHNVARGTFAEINGVMQPAPAPRFSRTAPVVERPPARPGADTDDVLADHGFDAADIEKLRASGVVG